MSSVLKRIHDSYPWRRFRSSRIFPVALVGAIGIIVLYAIFPTGVMGLILQIYLALLMIFFASWDKRHKPSRRRHHE